MATKKDKEQQQQQVVEHIVKGAIKDIEMEIKPLPLKFRGVSGVLNRITIHNAYRYTLELGREVAVINVLTSKGIKELIEYIYGVLNTSKPKELNLDEKLKDLGMTLTYKVTALEGGKFLKGDLISY